MSDLTDEFIDMQGLTDEQSDTALVIAQRDRALAEAEELRSRVAELESGFVHVADAYENLAALDDRLRIGDVVDADDFALVKEHLANLHAAMDKRSKGEPRKIESAQPAASKERVMGVVRKELNDNGMWCDAINGDDTYAIAARVADQLATPADRKPSLSERRVAHGMRTPSDEERRESLAAIVTLDPGQGLEPVSQSFVSQQYAEQLASPSCCGCHDGMPLRRCAVTGDPVHRGMDHSYPCTSVAPVLSAEERDLVVKWNCGLRADHPTFASLIDRLLGAKP